MTKRTDIRNSDDSDELVCNNNLIVSKPTLILNDEFKKTSTIDKIEKIIVINILTYFIIAGNLYSINERI